MKRVAHEKKELQKSYMWRKELHTKKKGLQHGWGPPRLYQFCWALHFWWCTSNIFGGRKFLGFPSTHLVTALISIFLSDERNPNIIWIKVACTRLCETYGNVDAWRNSFLVVGYGNVGLHFRVWRTCQYEVY